jgi:hypothetical protein
MQRSTSVKTFWLSPCSAQASPFIIKVRHVEVGSIFTVPSNYQVDARIQWGWQQGRGHGGLFQWRKD